jgi:hypothetical protein
LYFRDAREGSARRLQRLKRTRRQSPPPSFACRSTTNHLVHFITNSKFPPTDPLESNRSSKLCHVSLGAAGDLFSRFAISVVSPNIEARITDLSTVSQTACRSAHERFEKSPKFGGHFGTVCPGRESNPDCRTAQAIQRPANFPAQIQGFRSPRLFHWWSRSTVLPLILPQICHKFFGSIEQGGPSLQRSKPV